jgi:hypothetical protein
MDLFIQLACKADMVVVVVLVEQEVPEPMAAEGLSAEMEAAEVPADRQAPEVPAVVVATERAFIFRPRWATLLQEICRPTGMLVAAVAMAAMVALAATAEFPGCRLRACMKTILPSPVLMQLPPGAFLLAVAEQVVAQAH